MSTQRDELRTAIGREVCNAMNYPPKVTPHILGASLSKLIEATASSVEAAGYQKPEAADAVTLHTEWAVQWDELGPGFPQEVHVKESHEAATAAVTSSAFPGQVVKRVVTDWEPAQ